ncbi:MAG: AMP-binding protein, partial [Christensenellales bacterium]
MKLSFSTLACPDFTWSEIYSMTKDFGLDGIEIRGLGNEISAIHAIPFTDDKIDSTIAKLAELNLVIPCLSSGCALKFKDKEKENIEELEQYIALAGRLSTPYVRVLADLEPRPSGEVDDSYVAEVLRSLAEKARKSGVTLLVESNGVYSDTSRLRRLLDSVADENVAALWDVNHPYRFGNESPEQTVANLGSLIRYVHVKDSVVASDGNVSYKLFGEGDMPFDRIFAALESIGYDGFVSLEWVKRWSNELCDAGIIVPQFANYMSVYRKKKRPLQDNKAKTGKYVWKKETLIDETFPDVLDRICEEFPSQYAFRYTELDYTRTYPQFRDDVDEFARSLIAMGVKRGDHVAIWATNVPAWYITFWATTKIGAVLVTVNTAYKIHEAEYLLRQSDTHTLVMIDGFKDSDYVAIINEICPELATCEPGKLDSKRLPYLKNIVTVGFSNHGCYTWDDAIALSKTVPYSEVEARRSKIDKNDVCNMQYTSGTTGFPKGVMLTHYNV